jgi:hypothetical protein
MHTRLLLITLTSVRCVLFRKLTVKITAFYYVPIKSYAKNTHAHLFLK